jgi:hypothetical protein
MMALCKGTAAYIGLGLTMENMTAEQGRYEL